MSKFLRTSRLAILAVALAAAAGAASAGDAEIVAVDAPYLRALPPHIPVAGAFMTLHNTGRKEVRLVRADSTVAKSVELHTHRIENGMMAMRRIPEMRIPAGGALVLEPSGYHIMLIGLKAPLRAGAVVPITLTFSDGSSRGVEAAVGGAHAVQHAVHTH